LIIIFPGPPAQAYGLHKSLADEFPVRSGSGDLGEFPWAHPKGMEGPGIQLWSDPVEAGEK